MEVEIPRTPSTNRNISIPSERPKRNNRLPDRFKDHIMYQVTKKGS